MKYLITGGAGFIGSHLAGELATSGKEVIILDDLFSGSKKNIEPFSDRDNVSFVQGSITDTSLVGELCNGVDGIFHEAAIPSVPRSLKNPLRTNEVNVAGTLNVLAAARDAGINRMVFASSSSVYGDTVVLPKREDMVPSPRSPYAVSKLAGEYYCRVFSDLYGIRIAALRYFNVFGPRQDPESEYSAVIPRFITRILQDESPVIYGDGTQTRDFTYVRDVVQANIRAMDHAADGIFNIAYGSRINLGDLARMIMDITGKHPEIRYDKNRPGDIHDSLADISAAIKTFNYLPEYTVRSGMEETIRWYQNQH
jgi:UDP-glucose 4-epimerase